MTASYEMMEYWELSAMTWWSEAYPGYDGSYCLMAYSKYQELAEKRKDR